MRLLLELGGAVTKIKVGDYFYSGENSYLLLNEKRGKVLQRECSL